MFIVITLAVNGEAEAQIVCRIYLFNVLDYPFFPYFTFGSWFIYHLIILITS